MAHKNDVPRLMACALRLASRGWFVFPLRRGDKRPLPNFTKWEDRATTDIDQIDRWWHEGAYNIGVATGRSKLVVVDCDTAKGDAPPPKWPGARDGVDVLSRLAERAREALPRTFTVRTPSGLHLYFKSPRNKIMANTAGTLGWRIDTRGRGGYVVGPGSHLPGGYYVVVKDARIADLPGWIVDQLTAEPRVRQPLVARPYSSDYLAAVVARQANRVRAARPGGRNNALNIAAFILGQLVGSHDITEHDAWAVLLEAASRHVGAAGFTVTEMERTIQSGLKAGMQRPRRA